LIEGVKVKKLKVVPDERGRLMEMLRADDEFFVKFGQVYMTTAYPGVVKGWHYHKVQADNMVIVKGMMKIVLYDGREENVIWVISDDSIGLLINSLFRKRRCLTGP